MGPAARACCDCGNTKVPLRPYGPAAALICNRCAHSPARLANTISIVRHCIDRIEAGPMLRAGDGPIRVDAAAATAGTYAAALAPRSRATPPLRVCVLCSLPIPHGAVAKERFGKPVHGRCPDPLADMRAHVDTQQHHTQAERAAAAELAQVERVIERAASSLATEGALFEIGSAEELARARSTLDAIAVRAAQSAELEDLDDDSGELEDSGEL
jgi:hypothetical protein